MTTFKVSAKSKVNSVEGAITGIIEEEGRVEIKAIGAGAVNQAIKALATARGFLAARGIELRCVPAFASVSDDTNEKTIIKITAGAKEDM